MPNRPFAVVLGCLSLLAAPGVVSAQTVDAARGVAASPGSVAAPASSTDQVRAQIWAESNARMADYKVKADAHKIAMAAWDAEATRIATETERARITAEANQKAYEADMVAWRAQMVGCHSNNARGCRWPAPPPRRHRR